MLAVIADGRTEQLEGANLAASETSTVHIDGLGIDDEVVIDGRIVHVATGGHAALHLARIGCCGPTELTVRTGAGTRRATGELFVSTSKMNEEEFQRLRLDLEAVWAQLLHTPRPLAHVRREENVLQHHPIETIEPIWRAIAPTIRSIVAAPAGLLERHRSSARYAIARTIDLSRPGELTRAAATLGMVPTRPIVRNIDNEANRMVALLCDRAARQARREGRLGIASDATRLRSSPTLAPVQPVAPRRPSQLIRADQRYWRCWLALNRLTGPMTAVLEVPRLTRSGIQAIPELYEMWTFLRTCQAVERLVGAPGSPGYAVLTRRVMPERIHLELPRGTVIRFPGAVEVAFSPLLASTSASATDLERVRRAVWDPLAFAPLPIALHGHRRPQIVEPDVVVRAPSGLLVLDAKYIGTRWLDRTAQEIHAKYSRIVDRERLTARVHAVIAAHPHGRETDVDFAGYAARPLVPGETASWLEPALLDVIAGPA